MDAPVSISNPGPVGESDLLVLSPRQAFSFTHTGFPLALNNLEPGAYEVTLQFTPGIGSVPVTSNATTFRVEQ